MYTAATYILEEDGSVPVQVRHRPSEQHICERVIIAVGGLCELAIHIPNRDQARRLAQDILRALEAFEPATTDPCEVELGANGAPAHGSSLLEVVCPLVGDALASQGDRS